MNEFMWYLCGGVSGVVICCILKAIIISTRASIDINTGTEKLNRVIREGRGERKRLDEIKRVAQIAVESELARIESEKQEKEERERCKSNIKEVEKRLSAPPEERYRVARSGSLYKVEVLEGYIDGRTCLDFNTVMSSPTHVGWIEAAEEPNEFTDPEEAEALRQKLIDREGPWEAAGEGCPGSPTKEQS